MGKVKWENAKCLMNTFDEAMGCLKEDRHQFIACTREEGTRNESTLEASKVDGDRFVCEISFRNGSVYAHPGCLGLNEVHSLFTRFCHGEDFSFVQDDWKKLQNSKGRNFLFVIMVVLIAAAAFYYFHTR